MELHEHPAHGAGEPLVHGEPLALPVARAAELLELAGNRGVPVALPLPDLLDKRLAAEIMPRLFSLASLPLHDVLRCDARMVGAGHPERGEPGHTLLPDENVLDRVVERMAHVEHAGHVRRRNDYREPSVLPTFHPRGKSPFQARYAYQRSSTTEGLYCFSITVIF